MTVVIWSFYDGTKKESDFKMKPGLSAANNDLFNPTPSEREGILVLGVSIPAPAKGNFERAGHENSQPLIGSKHQLSESIVSGKLTEGSIFTMGHFLEERHGITDVVPLAQPQGGCRLRETVFENRLQEHGASCQGKEDSGWTRREALSFSLRGSRRMAFQERKEGQGVKIYLVQGLGVSLICEQGNSMLWWLEYIIERGGVPNIQLWARES